MSPNAAFIQKTLVVWVALLAVPLLRERVGTWHLAAIVLLVCGQALLGGGLAGIRLGAGELMIFAATLMWAVETVVVRRLLGSLSALTISNARVGGGVVLLAAYALATTRWPVIAETGWHQWSWTLAAGAILACYVAVWFTALRQATAADVTAILVLGAIITALLQAAVQGARLAPLAPGLVLLAAGVTVAGAAALCAEHWSGCSETP